VLVGNNIGTDASGTLSLGNLDYGVVLNYTSGNLVEYNTIAHSGVYGILMIDAGQNTLSNNVFIANAQGNVVAYNY
jgi:parallel beta-helix repeat protein